MFIYSIMEYCRELCQQYINDDSYVYWSYCCFGNKNYVVVCKLLDDTKTSSETIVNWKYARFKADKLNVVAIIPKFASVRAASYVYDTPCNKVAVGTIAKDIHYYKSFEPAFYADHHYFNKYTGPIIIYYNNGVKSHEMDYSNGKECGIQRHYYPSGNFKYTCTYVDGKKYGLHIGYHESGNRIDAAAVSKHDGLCRLGAHSAG